jgi:anthranilate synthase component 2
MSKPLQIYLVDNYDSFTFNLVHYLEAANNCNVHVCRNDEIDIEAIENYDAIVFSPGPGLPNEAGKMKEVIERYYSTKKMLGVCLGHQAIAEYFGAKLVNANVVTHGKATTINVLNESKLFYNTTAKFKVGRYHSWYVDGQSIPKFLKITATDESNIVMAFEHESLPIVGVQFHPESILTEHGLQIIENWKAI